jgi:uroporphyrinogen-III synthase
MSERLSGLRLWITRPEPAAARTARRFEEEGAQCRCEATVVLKPENLSPAQRAKLQGFLPGARLLLSSANAARYLLDAVADDPKLEEQVLQLPVSAVGEKTARAAHSLGWQVDHVASVALGLRLAQELVEQGATTRVLLPGSDRRRPEAEALLRDEGVEVLPLCVYRTLPASSLSPSLLEALEGGQLDASLVYSPSAVAGMLSGALAGGLTPRQLPPCLALGSTTASAVVTGGLRLGAAPLAPGEDALVEASVSWWAAKRADS